MFGMDQRGRPVGQPASGARRSGLSNWGRSPRAKQDELLELGLWHHIDRLFAIAHRAKQDELLELYEAEYRGAA